MLSSYPSIYALGHKAIHELFDGPVVVEEKVDGSQFSMGRLNGELHCRSKGQVLHVAAPEKMFASAVATATTRALREGWVYRCEYLQKPKHNTLAYDRVPPFNLIVFDVMVGPETYLDPAQKLDECCRIGLQCVPLFHHGLVPDPEKLREWLVRESILGGVKIEGVVVKNYNRFGLDKKILLGKFVSSEFKEKHQGEWKKSNPSAGDFIAFLTAQFKTDARWRKAVQHLREAGKLTDTPKDIGPLLVELGDDIEREEGAAIKEALFKHFWPQIRRGTSAGFAEFYKKELGIMV